MSTAARGAVRRAARGPESSRRSRRATRSTGPALELGGADARRPTALADGPVRIPLGMLNRHGLVAGATGTGKTKTLQLMAEQLSAHGVRCSPPTSRATCPGWRRRARRATRSTARAAVGRPAWTATGFPVEFFALGGQGTGIPLRATMTSFGPTLLSQGARAQRDPGVVASGWSSTTPTRPACRCSTSRTCARWCSYLTSDEGKAELKDLGGLSRATAGVILRELIAFEDQGADAFFGEPEFDTADLLRIAADGRGVDLAARAAEPAGPAGAVLDVPDVAARRPVPRPARGRRRRQAQAGLLLRRGAPALRRRVQGRSSTQIAQTVRLIRSKGVGVFFVTQTPEGRARRRARPARLPRPAPAARRTPRTTPRRSRRPCPPTRTRRTTTSARCSPSSASARRSSP